MKLRLLAGTAALAAVTAVVAVVILSLGDGGGGEEPLAAGVDEAGAGGGPEHYPTPIRRAPGDWWPPAFLPEKQERRQEAMELERQQPVFRGTVNGFRFFGENDPPKEFACDTSTVTVQSVTPEQMPFQVNYFPTGTVEDQKPYLQTCPDGAIHMAVRGFKVGPAAFSVGYWGGELAYYNGGGGLREGQVRPAVVHGKQGVIVEPFLPEGFGSSMLLWPSGDGYMRVYAFHLPFDEVLKVAEGVTCADC